MFHAESKARGTICLSFRPSLFCETIMKKTLTWQNVSIGRNTKWEIKRIYTVNIQYYYSLRFFHMQQSAKSDQRCAVDIITPGATTQSKHKSLETDEIHAVKLLFLIHFHHSFDLYFNSTGFSLQPHMILRSFTSHQRTVPVSIV